MGVKHFFFSFTKNPFGRAPIRPTENPVEEAALVLEMMFRPDEFVWYGDVYDKHQPRRPIGWRHSMPALGASATDDRPEHRAGLSIRTPEPDHVILRAGSDPLATRTPCDACQFHIMCDNLLLFSGRRIPDRQFVPEVIPIMKRPSRLQESGGAI